MKDHLVKTVLNYYPVLATLSRGRMLSLVVCVILFSSVGVKADTSETFSELKSAYDNLYHSRFAVLPHKSTYLLPYVYNFTPHEDIYDLVKPVNPKGGNSDFYKSQETEFQLSFALPIFRDGESERKWDILLAYTHHAWWQVYNTQWSRPFRETNYMPEIFGRYYDNSLEKVLGFNLLAIDGGYVHQSNGQIQILSRSWDRLFVRSYFQHNYFNMVLSGWYRLPEKKEVDDNRGIVDYMGYGELELIKNFGVHRAYFKMPILAEHFSYDVKYSYPIEKGLRWYFSFQKGYGHSLIEYNRSTERLGGGFMLENFIF